MAEEEPDCRGMASPKPVLKAREIIDGGNVERLTVRVDNPAAKENVGWFRSKMGYEVSLSEEGGTFRVTGQKGDAAAPCKIMEDPKAQSKESRIAVLLGTDRMGKGDDTLGQKLCRKLHG